MPQKQKMEEEQEEKKGEEAELDDKEKLVGTFYVLHNLKERFEITETEEHALDYGIYLINRERRWMEEGDYKDRVYEGEEEEETATPKPTGLKPVLGITNREIEGYV